MNAARFILQLVAMAALLFCAIGNSLAGDYANTLVALLAMAALTL